MKVEIGHKEGDEAGTVTIRFKSLEELDDLCRILTAG
jgi:ParB family chromosome partitioning protein